MYYKRLWEISDRRPHVLLNYLDVCTKLSRINEGMKLRYAIRVDDGPVEIRDINADEWSRTWSENVLQGFAKGKTNHSLERSIDHEVTLYLLDPGMVLSQVRVFTTQ